MKLFKQLILFTIPILLLTGCTDIETNLKLNNKGNIEEIFFQSSFDKTNFDNFFNTNFVLNPPPPEFYETHPTITEDMSEGLKKFAFFFEDNLLKSFNLETILPENTIQTFLQKACTYSEDFFSYYAECGAEIPFFVSLPLTSSILNGSTTINETAKTITYTGEYNSFLNIPPEVFLTNNLNIIFNIEFPHKVISVKGEGTIFDKNTVTIDFVKLKQNTTDSTAGQTIIIVTEWVEIIPFWQKLWFRATIAIIGFITATRFILKLLAKRHMPPSNI